uniref:Uncharacterized protein n=1 Tax=Anopheles atroparvus TaxID=41427 RepID=A0A182ILM3_ANOAO
MDKITYLGKSNKIAIFETVASFVQARHDAFDIVRNAGDHGRTRSGPILIVHGKIDTEVTEDLGEQAPGIGGDERDVVTTGNLRDPPLLRRRGQRKHHHTELLQKLLRQLARVGHGRDVVVQVGELLAARLGSIAPVGHIFRGQVELRREVADRANRRVMQGDRFHSTENYILGHFHTEPTQAGDQHVRAGHATHRIVPQDVQLARGLYLRLETLWFTSDWPPARAKDDDDEDDGIVAGCFCWCGGRCGEIPRDEVEVPGGLYTIAVR